MSKYLLLAALLTGVLVAVAVPVLYAVYHVLTGAGRQGRDWDDA